MRWSMHLFGESLNLLAIWVRFLLKSNFSVLNQMMTTENRLKSLKYDMNTIESCWRPTKRSILTWGCFRSRKCWFWSVSFLCGWFVGFLPLFCWCKKCSFVCLSFNKLFPFFKQCCRRRRRHSSYKYQNKDLKIQWILD